MKLPFDEVYLLNLCERPDKYETMSNRIYYMGWDVKDFRVVKHPISDEIINMLGNNLGGKHYAIYNSGVFNCTREHYTIIKSAYLRGLNTIGIIEDDCSFYKDHKVWEEYLNNLPNDWDILRINCLRDNDYNGDKYWYKQRNLKYYGTGFYILNRNGMKYMIDKIDSCYQPIDEPLFNVTDFNINVYVPKFPLSLCLEDSLQSDIRGDCSSNEPHIKYKSFNINRTDYI